jgi:hypothetical protein
MSRYILLRWLCSISLLVCAAQSLHADDVTGRNCRKAAWEWTLEERLAARFDPHQMRQRIAAARETGAHGMVRVDPSMTVASLASAEQLPTIIDGNRNPELFLSWELFDDLLREAYVEPSEARDTIRATFLERATRLSLPPDFWDRLAVAAASRLELIARERELLAARSVADVESRRHADAELDLIEAQLCSARSESLRKARIAFGEETFNRFLYVAVAPNLKYQMEPGKAGAKELRAGEEGCK